VRDDKKRLHRASYDLCRLWEDWALRNVKPPIDLFSTARLTLEAYEVTLLFILRYLLPSSSLKGFLHKTFGGAQGGSE